MDGESAPPAEFKRMLSWQLSHAREAPVVTSRKRQKRLQKRKAKAEEVATAPDHECSSSSEGECAEQEGSGYAYLVVNSEGEEEWYYSAPESPVESGDEPWDGELNSGTCTCTLQNPPGLSPSFLLSLLEESTTSHNKILNEISPENRFHPHDQTVYYTLYR